MTLRRYTLYLMVLFIIIIFWPYLSNQLHVAAAVDRRDRQTDRRISYIQDAQNRPVSKMWTFFLGGRVTHCSKSLSHALQVAWATRKLVDFSSVFFAGNCQRQLPLVSRHFQLGAGPRRWRHQAYFRCRRALVPVLAGGEVTWLGRPETQYQR